MPVLRRLRLAYLACRLGAIAIDIQLKVEPNCLDFVKCGFNAGFGLAARRQRFTTNRDDWPIAC